MPNLSRYLELIFRQRSITDVAAQQLLLDTTVLESLLLQLPKISHAVNEISLSSYTKVVKSRIAQIEGVLKLLSTSSSLVVERFVSLLPEGTVADLQAVMTLKGMKKQDQTALVETYQASHPNALKSAPSQGSSDTFPMLVSIAGVAAAVSSSSSLTSSMRNLTTDLSFTVGPLKWTSKGSS